MTFASIVDAETWLTTQESDIIRRTWKADDRGRDTLRAYSIRWLAGRTDLKPRTSALYAGLLDRHILPEVVESACQILARHADPRTTEHCDRARGNLDRHGVHFLTAYVAGV